MATYTFVVLVLLNLSLSHAGLGDDYENYVQNEDNNCTVVEEMQNKFSELEQSVNSKINVLLNMDQNIIKAVKENQYLACKEYHAIGNLYLDYFNLDANSHIMYRKDSLDGGLYVEMHLAIKGDPVFIMIAPSEEAKSQGPAHYIELGINTAYINWFKTGKQIGGIKMPNMRDPDRFTPVYIRITHDKLEFGKEGGPPLMTYTDAALKLAARFAVGTDINKTATVLYDCPAIVF